MKFIAVILLWCCRMQRLLPQRTPRPVRLTTRRLMQQGRARAAPAHGPARSLRPRRRSPQPWLAEVRAQNGARFDFQIQYLPGGVGKGEPWFFKYKSLEHSIASQQALGNGAWFTWYMLEQSMPAEYKPTAQESAVHQRQEPGDDA